MDAPAATAGGDRRGGATASTAGGGGASNSNIVTQTGVRIIAPHHKTEDLMQNQGPLDITLPPGRPLTDMLVHWIQHGWHCLVSSTRSSTSSLFLSSAGNPFTDSTFWQYWMKLLQDRPVGLDLFPPNMARTSFVEAFTEGEQVYMDECGGDGQDDDEGGESGSTVPILI